MKHFLQWCYDDYLTEAESDPTTFRKPYMVPPKWVGARTGLNVINKLLGRGEVDWRARDRANRLAQQKWAQDKSLGHQQAKQQLGASGRQRAQDIGYGEPDDPKIRRQKANTLSKLFVSKLNDNAKGASRHTKNAINQAANKFAQALTGHPTGRPINDIEMGNLLRAIHADDNISLDQIRYHWPHHMKVAHELISVFKDSPSTWYQPHNPDGLLAPGGGVDGDAINKASEEWKNDPNNKLSNKKIISKDVDVVDVLFKNYPPRFWRGHRKLNTIDDVRNLIQNTKDHIEKYAGNPIVDHDKLMQYLAAMNIGQPPSVF